MWRPRDAASTDQDVCGIVGRERENVMRKILFVTGLLTVAVFTRLRSSTGVAAGSSPIASAAIARPPPSTLPTLVPAPSTTEEIARTKATERLDTLAGFTLDVMLGWRHAASALPVIDYAGLSRDIATAVILEPAAFDDMHAPCKQVGSELDPRRCRWASSFWSADNAKATLLAAVGYWEGSRYAEYVDAGQCNDRSWRKTPEGAWLMKLGGDCDGGHAFSLWQIHPIAKPANVLFDLCNARVVAKRMPAARCALEMLRRSLAADGTLGEYTGESLYGAKRPKADERLNFAKDALKAHASFER